MSVFAVIRVDPDEFELGRILAMAPETTVVLESMVPLGERAVPFVRVLDGDYQAFEDHVRGHAAVERFQLTAEHDGERLYALQWSTSDETLVEAFRDHDATLLEGKGTATVWRFELRFPSHEALSAFVDHCSAVDLDVSVTRIYNPTKPDGSPWYGLSDTQRKTLVRAVSQGYYDVPGRISTKELGEQLGVSDQAITERLRRGISTLVENTLMATEFDEETGFEE